MTLELQSECWFVLKNQEFDQGRLLPIGYILVAYHLGYLYQPNNKQPLYRIQVQPDGNNLGGRYQQETRALPNNQFMVYISFKRLKKDVCFGQGDIKITGK